MNFLALEALTVWFKNVNSVLTDFKIYIFILLKLGFFFIVNGME